MSNSCIFNSQRLVDSKTDYVLPEDRKATLPAVIHT